MAHLDLARLDLNLLVTLEMLLEERSVTRAAMRLGRTQSAVSHSLKRLRELFDDRLLVQTRTGLDLTPRAAVLQGALQRTLDQVAFTFRGSDDFDPASVQHTFSIGTTDYAQSVLLPGLMARLSTEAPGFTLELRAYRDDIEQALIDGTLDLAIGAVFLQGAGLHESRLFQDRFVVISRADHAALKDGLTLESYVALPHVLIAPRGRPGGFVDDQLAARGLSRRISLRVPTYLAAPQVIAASDLLLTLPERLVPSLQSSAALKAWPLPLPMPSFSMRQVWHERNQDDPCHRYLRQQLSLVGKALPILETSGA